MVRKRFLGLLIPLLIVAMLNACNVDAPSGTNPSSAPPTSLLPASTTVPSVSIGTTAQPTEPSVPARWEGRPEGTTAVMSLNVLTTAKAPIYETQRNGATRCEAFLEMMEDCMPDSIGLCEVTNVWLYFLQDNICADLPYGICGKVSSSGQALRASSGELNPILYRNDKYTVLEEGGYWLSSTPDIPSKYGPLTSEDGATTYEGMYFARAYSYAVFQWKDSGEVAYIHINTHLDHKSDSHVDLLCTQQIKASADLLQDRFDCPVVITGDFNEREDHLGYLYLADPVNGYVNAKYQTDDYSKLTTAGGYGTNYQRGYHHVIDHVFLSCDDATVVKHDVLELPYLSDHSPVYVELILP